VGPEVDAKGFRERRVVGSLSLPDEFVPEEALRLPRRDVAQLLRKLRGIAGLREGFTRQDRGGGVMSMPALAGRREARHDDIRLKSADVPDDVGEDRVVSPDLQRLGRILREAEVDGPREELLAAVDAPGIEELLRPEDAEELGFFVADEVLSAVAARH